MTTFNRRRLLEAMGLVPGTLFLPSLFRNDRAAYAATPPKRVFIFHTQHGPPHWDWTIPSPASGVSNKGGYSEFALGNLTKGQMSPVLQPLFAQRNDLLVIDGVSSVASFASGVTNCHNLGNGTVLTGAKVKLGAGYNNEGTGGDISVDQVISSKVAVPGRKPYLYACTWGCWNPVFAGPGREIVGPNEPGPLYDSILSLAPSGGTAKPVGPDKFALGRASLVDLVRPDYDALAKKLSGDDQKKVQQHLALMNDLQVRLKAVGGGSTADGGGAACTLGARSPGVAQPAENAEATSKVMAAAFACDITRVGVQVHGQLNAEEFGAPSGKDVHQDIAHQANTAGTQESKWMTMYYQRHATQFSSIIEAFRSIPEGNGTMLDNSVLLWTTEIGDGPHNLYNMSLVMAGGCQGYFKTGRCLKYDQSLGNPATSDLWGGFHKTGPAHNKVLVSLMQAMGLPNTSIGLTSVTGNSQTGGGTIDMTGELPGLRG